MLSESQKGPSIIHCKSSVLQWKLSYFSNNKSWRTHNLVLQMTTVFPDTSNTHTHTHAVPVLYLHLRVAFLLYIPRTSPAPLLSAWVSFFSLPLLYTHNWHSSLPFLRPNSPSAKAEGGKRRGKGKKRKGEENQWMGMRRKGKERQIALIM